jgi:hypothetical protein
MKSLFAAFKTLKRVMSGKVVEQMDTQANSGFTTMSLRLKKTAPLANAAWFWPNSVPEIPNMSRSRTTSLGSSRRQ